MVFHIPPPQSSQLWGTPIPGDRMHAKVDQAMVKAILWHYLEWERGGGSPGLKVKGHSTCDLEAALVNYCSMIRYGDVPVDLFS